MKAVVKMVNGDEFTLTGDIAESIYRYFTGKKGANETLPIGWVGDSFVTINFNHAISVKFSKE